MKIITYAQRTPAKLVGQRTLRGGKKQLTQFDKSIERITMTGYMAEMRKLVGHRTIIQCAASIICIDEQGRILLGKRKDNHKWGYSGGSVEIDEYVEDCAKRELYEEMGLKADNIEFFFVNSGPEAHYIYPNGDEVSNFEIIYICTQWSGDPIARDGEMEELKFFYPQEINISEISPPIRNVVYKLLERTIK